MKSVDAASLKTLFVLLGLMTATMPLATDMYLPALPDLERDLGASAAGGQLTLSSFFLGTAFGQLLYGRASDLYGRRPVLFFSLGLFIVSSLGCALAPALDSMIVLRLFQALGACGSVLIARAVVFDTVSAREGARFLSQLVLIQGLAPILAPLLGGWIVVVAGWRPIFYLLGALGLLLLLAAFFMLPETRTREQRGASHGETALQSYMAIITNWPLMRVSLAGSLAGASFFTYLSNAPQILIGNFHIPPDHFGYYFGANAIGLIGASQVNRVLLSHFPPERILRVSLVVTFAIALVLLMFSRVTGFGPWPVLIPLFVLISSFAFVMPNAMAIAQERDQTRPGAVAAISGSVGFAAGAVSGGVSGLFADGTAGPMALVIVVATGCGLMIALTDRAPH